MFVNISKAGVKASQLNNTCKIGLRATSSSLVFSWTLKNCFVTYGSDRPEEDTVYPIFWNFALPLHFYERPTLVPVFTNQKRSEEDFCFYEIRQKVKIAFIVFCSEPLQKQHAPQAGRRAGQAPSLGTTLHLGIKLQSFELCL